ncbi:MAG: hypothetical protein IJ675_08180, partial [Pseudobutyrivibrio sp.]|nr:hypothetical protein [Pseudobutyrivibrio sp.]
MTEADFQIVQNIYELGIMIIHLGILIGLFYIFVPSEALEKRKLYGLLTTIVLERIIVWIIPHDTKGIFFLVSLVTLIAFLFKEMREVQCLFLYIFFLWHSIFSICFMLTEIFTSALSDKLLARVDYSLSNPMEDVYRQLSIWIGFSTLIYALVVIVELVIIKATVKQKYFMTIREAAGLSVYTIVTLLLMYMFAEMAVVPVGSEVFIFTEQNRSLVLKQPVIAVLLYVGQLGGLIIWQEFQALKEREIEHQQILSQTEYAKRYIDDLESYYTKIRILKHDMAGKLTTLRGLLETDSKEAAIDYLSKMDVELSGSDNKYKTG